MLLTRNQIQLLYRTTEPADSNWSRIKDGVSKNDLDQLRVFDECYYAAHGIHMFVNYEVLGKENLDPDSVLDEYSDDMLLARKDGGFLGGASERVGRWDERRIRDGLREKDLIRLRAIDQEHLMLHGRHMFVNYEILENIPE